MATPFSLDQFRAAPPLVRAKAVAKGLPVKAVQDLVADKAVTLANVAGVVGPRRTLQRRLAEGGTLSPEESDRLARFITVLDLATSLFGTRKAAMDWLAAPKRRLDGEAPLALMSTDAGTRLVEEIIEQARHGFTA